MADILEALDCHSIKKINNYYIASNPDGDAKAAINIHIESLNVKNHTRSDFPEHADIITLVEYMKKLYFSQAINWICEVCGYDYYQYEKQEQINDPCLLFLEEIDGTSGKSSDPTLRKLNENILNEYIQYPNIWLLNEGINYYTQKQFEIGFCVRDERITFPVRDEIGNLVGVKGRTTLDHDVNIPRYLYLYQMPKTMVLYGLDKSLPYIKETEEVIVFESEKSVLKAYSMGFMNSVSIGGHELSETQVTKLERIGVNIVLAFDNDIEPKQIKKEYDKFLFKDKVYSLLPRRHKQLLQEKDAPVDRGIDTWLKLWTNDKYKVH